MNRNISWGLLHLNPQICWFQFPWNIICLTTCTKTWSRFIPSMQLPLCLERPLQGFPWKYFHESFIPQTKEAEWIKHFLGTWQSWRWEVKHWNRNRCTQASLPNTKVRMFLDPCLMSAPVTTFVRTHFPCLHSVSALPEHCQLALEGSYTVNSFIMLEVCDSIFAD